MKPAPSLHSVVSCSISNILISDHASIVLDLSLKGIGNRVKHWRQNTTVLEDHTFVSYFNTEFLIFGVPSQKLGTIFYVQGNRISDNKLIIGTFKAFYSTAK